MTRVKKWVKISLSNIINSYHNISFVSKCQSIECHLPGGPMSINGLPCCPCCPASELTPAVFPDLNVDIDSNKFSVLHGIYAVP